MKCFINGPFITLYTNMIQNKIQNIIIMQLI